MSNSTSLSSAVSSPPQQPVTSKWLSAPIRNSLLAGSCAGIAATLLVHPMDTIRTRLQTTSAAQFRGAFHCFQSTVQNEGMRALYKGMAFPLAAQGVYKSIMFGGYEAAQRIVKATRSDSKAASPLSLLELFFCGGFAGALNSLVVTPVELVRNRLMVQYSRVAAGASTTNYAGPLDAVRQIVKENGMRGLWRGQVPTLCRDFPGVGCFYVANEFSKRKLAEDFPTLPMTGRMMIAGASAGVAFWSVALPVDTIKSLVQTDRTNASTYELVSARVREFGVSSLYRGWSVALTRGIPSAAITFTVFGRVNNYLNTHYPT